MKSSTFRALLTRPQMASVSFLNFVLLMVSELSSIIEYMSGSRYLVSKKKNNKKKKAKRDDDESCCCMNKQSNVLLFPA